MTTNLRRQVPRILLAALATALVATLFATARMAPSAGASSGVSAPNPFTIALVVNGTLGDKGFFDSAQRGMDRMASQLGAQTKTLQASPTNPSQWLQNLQAVSNGKYSLVITGTSQMVNQIKTVSTAHPKQPYIMFDAPVPGKNVASIAYQQNEGSFLAGVLAGEVTTSTKAFPLSKGTLKVGLVGGMDIPVINDFVVGFKKGVKYVNPKIQILLSYAGTFADPQKGYNQAMAMYNSGADVVYNVAGATGLGVLRASKAANKYSIGVDSNQNGLYPGHVVASMTKRVDNSIFDLAKMFKAGKLVYNHTYIYGLKNKGIGLVIDHSLVPSSIVK